MNIARGWPNGARAAQWRAHAKSTGASLVTTRAVLHEMLNSLSAPAIRTRAVEVYRGCFDDPSITVVNFEDGLMEEAIGLYAARRDKDWGINDCLSFVVMGHRGISQALTADRHFEQAGFGSLLLRDPPSA
jgi:predicted nucleic acid-binding protein